MGSFPETYNDPDCFGEKKFEQVSCETFKRKRADSVPKIVS